MLSPVLLLLPNAEGIVEAAVVEKPVRKLPVPAPLPAPRQPHSQQTAAPAATLKKQALAPAKHSVQVVRPAPRSTHNTAALGNASHGYQSGRPPHLQVG